MIEQLQLLGGRVHPLAVHQQLTRAGLEILRQGGNAFDASAAVSLALSVVERGHLPPGEGCLQRLFSREKGAECYGRGARAPGRGGAARAVAEALGAQKLVFLTDVGGILIDSHNTKTAVPHMDVKRALELMDAGLIAGGMAPKVRGCVHAIQSGVGQVSILDGRVLTSSFQFE